MIKFLNYLLPLYFLNIFLLKSLDQNFFKNTHILKKNYKTNIILISSDNIKYSIPLEIAIQSNYIQRNILNNQIKIDIESKILEKLISGLTIIYKFETNLNRCSLFELLQKDIFNKIPYEDTNIFLLKLNLLDCELLTISFLDIYSQILLNNNNYTLYTLFGLSELCLDQAVLTKFLCHICKYYYIRKKSTYPKLDFRIKSINEDIDNELYISKEEYSNFDSSNLKLIYTFK